MDTEPNPPRNTQPFALRLRLIAAAILLVPAVWFSWKTVDGLARRRAVRTDLAEIANARYGILSASRWRSILGPMLDAQASRIDLQGQSKNLRPMVERSLYALLDNIKSQMSAPQAKGSGMPGAGNAMLVNMIVASLRPHVPEYTGVVMAQLARPETEKSFQQAIRGVLADAVKNTFGGADMTEYNAIFDRYGCARDAEDSTNCQRLLSARIALADSELTRDYLIVLGCSALGFVLLAAGAALLTRAAVVVLMLFSIAMLTGGVLSPMLEVEVRVTKIDATLLGTPIEFQDQSLYYRSKTVLEVFKTLIEMGRPEMTLVAVLLVLFSVVFPALKMLALAAGLLRPSLFASSRIVKLFAFDLSKWSMADVMALAIFMSFVAFNGVAAGALGGLRDLPNIRQATFPTDASRILPGYYLFVGFCLSSVVLSARLKRGIALRDVSPRQ